MFKKCFLVFLMFAFVAVSSGCSDNPKCQANNNDHPSFAADNCTSTPVRGGNFCRFHTCGLDDEGCLNRNGVPVASRGTPGDIECTSCM